MRPGRRRGRTMTRGGHPGGPRGRRGRGPRTRWRDAEGGWHVEARDERFGEPVLLMLLRERSRHGYELLELLPDWVGDRRVDLGNLYRMLRALEDDGVVGSRWDDDAPGPAKRVYWLTESGQALLDRWIEALVEARARVARVLEAYEEGEGVNE